MATVTTTVPHRPGTGADRSSRRTELRATELPPARRLPRHEAPPAPERRPAATSYGGTLADGEFGESYIPDPDILAQGLGGAGSLPEEERARNIALATIARASIPVDEDLALQCWEENGCDTGTGGELKVGLADGFGGNIARQIFKMEFILQALTYPEIGEIGYTDANLDTQKAISDVRSFAAQGYDVILSFPDAGEAMVPAYRAATEQGAQVVTWSSGKVGEPGTDYLTYSGSDICALGHAWGEQFNESLPDGGQIAMITGAPGNPIDPVHERVPARDARPQHRDRRQAGHRVEPPGVPRGDVGDPRRAPRPRRHRRQLRRRLRRGDAGLRGGRDADGRTGHDAPVRRQPVPVRVEGRRRGDGVVHLRRPAPRGPAGVTAAMMKIAGYDVPPEIIFGVQLKPVTMESCRTDIPPDGSPSSLVPPELQSRMFPE